MDLNLRQAIIQKVQDKSPEELQEIVQDSLHGEDALLPGLGVLFEIIWEHSGKEVQEQLVKTLKANLA